MQEPENRTLQGFFRLLEREWFQGSYNSTDFNGILQLSKLTNESGLASILSFGQSTDEAPLLLIMLFDCLFQLLATNPTRFEFTQDLLLALLDENMLCRFESSITLSRTERQGLASGVSLWEYLSSSQLSHKMVSSRYDKTDLQSTEILKSRMTPWTRCVI
jgi:hypothetical protein